jgi:ribose transport system ATP-binding protein
LVDVVKAFGPTVAVKGASLACVSGEIHGVIGENGAGKSTMMKILNGTVRPDSGSVLIQGREVHFQSARDALRAGIATAFQELTVESNLTVAENLLLGREPTFYGLVTGRRLRASARKILAEWNADDLSPGDETGKLALSARQRLEIVRALSRNPRILILDEPTSALGVNEVRWLFEQLRRVVEGGVAVIYISHRMDEINLLCQRVTVMRDGRNVETFEKGTRTEDAVMEMMLGRSLVHAFQSDAQAADQASSERVVMNVEKLTSGSDLHEVSFDLHAGEILGVAALQGHGQLSLFLSMFGAKPITTGSISLDGKRVRLRSPRDAIRAGLGISLVPENRQEEGLLLGMSGVANLSLPSLRRYTTFGFLRSGREQRDVRNFASTVNLDGASLARTVSSLSGGNQQKVVFGKWLLAESRVLLLYDPTRGVDVGTKEEIFALMVEFAQAGGSVLFFSTDVEELVTIPKRVLVLYRGRVADVLSTSSITRDRILSSMLGGRELAVA